MKNKIVKNKKNRKTYFLILISFILGIIISITSSYAIAETLIKSADVSYVDNSNLKATNVQAAIDGTCTKFSNDLTDLKTNLKKEILNEAYPVNSVYISYSNTNPGTLFGGTWEIIGDGRVLKGIKSGTAGTTGGSSTVTLSTDNLPAHTHNISHTHTTPATSFSANTGAGISSSSGWLYYGGSDSNLLATHDIVAGISSKGWYGTYPAGSSTVAGMGLNHYHTVSITVPKMTTDSISTTTSGSAGSTNPTAINVQDPYITVYMWKRTK